MADANPVNTEKAPKKAAEAPKPDTPKMPTEDNAYKVKGGAELVSHKAVREDR